MVRDVKGLRSSTYTPGDSLKNTSEEGMNRIPFSIHEEQGYGGPTPNKGGTTFTRGLYTKMTGTIGGTLKYPKRLSRRTHSIIPVRVKI